MMGVKRRKMIKVKLTGKANAEFIVKNPKKIAMWKMLEEKNKANGIMVFINIEEIKQ